MLKITKKLLRKRSKGGINSLTLTTCGRWVTNGDFAIRRDHLKGGDAFTDQRKIVEEFGDLARNPEQSHPDIGSVLPRDPESGVTMTALPWSTRDGMWDRVPYVGRDLPPAFIARYYAEWLDFRGLMVDPPGFGPVDGFRSSVLWRTDEDGEPWLLMMPCRATPKEVDVTNAIAGFYEAPR